MNLAPVSIEHADRDGAGRPVNVRDKRNCADSVPGVGCEFANDVRVSVEKLDSVLHGLSAPGTRAVPNRFIGGAVR
jgi:hypothetical protein